MKKYPHRRARLRADFSQRSHRTSRLRNGGLTVGARSGRHSRRGRRRNINLAGGLLSLLVGVGLSMWVLVPPTLSEFPSSYNAGNIAAYSNGSEQIKGVDYKVNLIPNPTTEDVLVIVETNLKRSAATRYEVEWPGAVRLHEAGTVEAATKGDGELLGVRIDWQAPTRTKLIISGSDDSYYSRNDRFLFNWVRGKDKLTFTDRRVRLRIVPIGGSLSLEVSFLGSQRLIQESPPASGTYPNTVYGGITHLYEDQRNVIVTFTENNEQILAQFVLLLAGILIGLSTNLIAQFVADSLEGRRGER